MAKFIAIEGADRCGKATQAALLRDHLQDIGFKVASVEVPVDDRFTHKVIYWMLRNGLAKKFPLVFQMLQVLNRRIFQEFTLRFHEDECDFVVADRWSPSTYAYGRAAGLSKETLDALCFVSRRPDHTFVLLGDSHLHKAEDSFESDHDLQSRVRDAYAEWASMHAGECCVIDCRQDRGLIAAEIVMVLRSLGMVPDAGGSSVKGDTAE